MALRNLFRKEWRSAFPLYGVFAGLVLLWHLFILYKRDWFDQDTIMVLALIMPFVFASLITIGMGYQQLQVEWKTNSVYLLLSLPVRGWKLLMVKIAALMSLVVATLLWSGLSYVLILMKLKWTDISENITELWPMLSSLLIHSTWIYLLSMVLLLILVQFTFLCGQLVAKFKWLVTLAAFLGMLWFVLRISPLLTSLLQWTPDISFGHKDFEVIYLQSGSFLVLLLLGVGLTALNGFIFEKEVEV